MSQKVKTIDLTLFIIPIILVIVSISVIYSLVYNTQDINLVLKQSISSVIGIILMFSIFLIDYRFFRGINWILYLITILLLIYVDFFGVAAGGAMRWINLGFFQLQPSELAKVFLIIVLSSFFSTRIGKIRFVDILFSAFIVLVPLVLILKEPDLGTAIVVSFVYLVIFLLSRPKRWQSLTTFFLVVVFTAMMFLSAFSIKPFDKLMHDYQRNRILTFIDPDLDPYGKGYNVRQAQITVGSGGIFGKGLGRGSQSQLQFLPKPHTDFIFAGIAESFGFIGTSLFLLLIVFLTIKIINVAFVAQDNFGMLIAFGTAAMIMFQVIVNIGMNLGIVPVTGIPLPFSSYGGSALLAYFFLIGLVCSIFARHKKITF